MCFWAGISWLAYVWIGYPLLLALASLVRRVRVQVTDNCLPSVSVLIAARNEQKDIGWKLTQTLAWDYPADRLEVLVGSDASTDGTDEVIQSISDPRLQFTRNQERAGKNITLNRLARLAKGELLFFTDANTHIAPQCLRTMVRHFSDPRVGCVTGMERNIAGSDESTITVASSTYLEYEALLDRLESKLASVLVCDGSVYCLRRSLFTDVDPDLANDLEHPIRVGNAGWAILFEPQARSCERCSSSAQEEFARRRRISAQGVLAMWKLRQELRGLRLWQFVSRKCLRWLTLLPMAATLISSFLLLQQTFFAVCFALQLVFYALAAVGIWQRDASRASACVRLPFAFLLANLAVLVGVLDACRGKKFAIWNIAELSRGANVGAGD